MAAISYRFDSGAALDKGRQAEMESYSVLGKAVQQKGRAVTHEPGEVLFGAGGDAAGVHMVRKGRVKLTMDSAEGKTLTLKIAKPGDFLDLGACVLGTPHEVTAEVLEPCEVIYLARPDFMRLIQGNGAACLEVALKLGHDFHDACTEITMLGLSRTAESKLAGVLLRMVGDAGSRTPMKLKSTHEELAQRIGSSRETVTRVLGRMRRSGVIETKGSQVVVRDPASLQRIENMEDPSMDNRMPMPKFAQPMRAAYAGR